MSWAEHAIWWHVYPLGFCGAPIRQEDPPHGPRLRRLLGWLDHAVGLGVSGLLLGPVSTSRTHGYDVLDPLHLDPRLGTEEDFDDLVAACRDRGLRIVADGVFSHVAGDHPDLLRALRDGPSGETAELYDIDWQAPGGPVPRVFEGHDSLARLDHASAQAADHATRVMRHWLDRGIDGWRLDAAYSVDPGFWARVLPRVREHHPEAWFLGEVIHGDYVSFIEASGVDSVTQYELWKAIWSSILDRNLFELDWALTRHNAFLRSFVPNTFIGNHDVTRIASTLGPDGAIAAMAILMTTGGIPSIYAGDEHGLTGIKEHRPGGDDAIRPAFPDTPERLGPSAARVLRAHQELIALRRAHPWLTTATTRSLTLENTRYDYRALSLDGGEHLDVEIDLTGPAPCATVRDPSSHVLWRQETA